MADNWPSHWQRSSLGDAADVNWGDTSTTKAAYVDAGFTAYSASGSDGFLPYADFDRTGVVLSAIGANCGRTWLAQGKWSCIKNTIRFWSKDPEVDTEFLYWVTRDPLIWPKRGSAQPFISQGDARKLNIAYPALHEQKEIANMLGALEQKIESSHRLNKTLEAMAQAIFKSWFVDFDPVRAKAEDRDTGLPRDIADLFPERFQESVWGLIPKGWCVGKFGDLLEFVKGRKPSKTMDSPEGGLLPVILIESLNSGRSQYAVPDEMIEVNGDDVLMVMDGASSGRVDTGLGGLVGSTLAKILPKQKVPGKSFLYAALKYLEPEIRQHLTGTSIPHVDKGWIVRQCVCIPGNELVERFQVIAALIKEEIIRTKNEIRCLANLRDTLLPKMIRGELRIVEVNYL
ncbi:MAG: restriction endonuclease subunit S [Elusimicrobia bacterium]|nr:restriction endonuclease subunit S [Elusimicrobiota bacterium]